MRLYPAALSAYARAPRPVRAHVHVRWLTCPFAPVAAAVPGRGRVLEIGCGYGVFSTHLALGSTERRVLGIDVDPRKIEAARVAADAARDRGAQLDFALAESGAVPAGPWDVIVIVDVLYLLSPDEQRVLLEACAAQLAAQGVLVIKEMADRPRVKALWNTLQETLAVRVLGLTHGERLHFVTPRTMASWLAATGLVTTERPLHRGYPHPHHLLVARRS